MEIRNINFTLGTVLIVKYFLTKPQYTFFPILLRGSFAKCSLSARTFSLRYREQDTIEYFAVRSISLKWKEVYCWLYIFFTKRTVHIVKFIQILFLLLEVNNGFRLYLSHFRTLKPLKARLRQMH